MAKTNHSRTLAAAALAAGVLLALVLFAARPAEAAFPGSTGDIAASFRDWDNVDASNEPSHIYAYGPDGTGAGILTGASATHTNLFIRAVVRANNPSWSADGTKVAFQGSTAGGGSPEASAFDIYWVPRVGGIEGGNLTDDYAGLDVEPAWFPNGTQIAFASDRSGNMDIYVMTLDDDGQPIGDPVQLTTNEHEDGQPVVSPDGTKIAFVSDRGGNKDIYVMKANAPEGSTNVPKKLTKSTATDEHPDWAPSGAQIAFDSNRSGNFEVYRMKARPEGSRNRPVNLTKNAATTDLDPAWAPDGTKIAFSRLNPSDTRVYGLFRMRASDGANQVFVRSHVDQTEEFPSVTPSWQPIP